MKTLTILESASAAQSIPEGHVMSFCDGPADSFPEDYIRAEDIKGIEGDAFSGLVRFLEDKQSEGHSFIYRNVDLLWCFKKKLFNYLCFVQSRFELFRKVSERHTPEAIEIRGGRECLDMPYLRTILGAWEQPNSIHFVDTPVMTRSRKKRGLFKGQLFPSVLSWNRKTRRKVAIYSDQRKSGNIQRLIGPEKVICYTHVKSPRLFIHALRSGEGFYQAATEQPAPHYRSLAAQFLETFQKANFFRDFRWGQLDWEKLLGQRVQDLFKSELPSLLFSIDHMIRFFQEESELQTALLDEDIAPPKNAFAQLAKIFDVSTFVACHGALGKRTSYLPLTARGIFVWGEAQKEKLTGWGCPEDLIHVTGCARYSSYQITDNRQIRNEVVRELGLSGEKKIVVVGFMIARNNRRRLFDHKRKHALLDILESALVHPHVDFVIKIKNEFDENFNTVGDWLRGNPDAKNVHRVTDGDSMRLMLASDAVVFCNTTLGIEAFALGKPVISYFGDECRLTEEFEPYEVFHTVKNSSEFNATLDRILVEQTPPDRTNWERARKQCLNDGTLKPEELISRVLDEEAVPV